MVVKVLDAYPTGCPFSINTAPDPDCDVLKSGLSLVLSLILLGCNITELECY